MLAVFCPRWIQHLRWNHALLFSEKRCGGQQMDLRTWYGLTLTAYPLGTSVVMWVFWSRTATCFLDGIRTWQWYFLASCWQSYKNCQSLHWSMFSLSWKLFLLKEPCQFELGRGDGGSLRGWCEPAGTMKLTGAPWSYMRRSLQVNCGMRSMCVQTLAPWYTTL